jgi:hypothetical protein
MSSSQTVNQKSTNSGAVMGGTPFVWSNLVAGKKTSLLDTQAEEQRKVDEKQKKADEAEKVVYAPRQWDARRSKWSD